MIFLIEAKSGEEWLREHDLRIETLEKLADEVKSREERVVALENLVGEVKTELKSCLEKLAKDRETLDELTCTITSLMQTMASEVAEKVVGQLKSGMEEAVKEPLEEEEPEIIHVVLSEDLRKELEERRRRR